MLPTTSESSFSVLRTKTPFGPTTLYSPHMSFSILFLAFRSVFFARERLCAVSLITSISWCPDSFFATNSTVAGPRSSLFLAMLRSILKMPFPSAFGWSGMNCHDFISPKRMVSSGLNPSNISTPIPLTLNFNSLPTFLLYGLALTCTTLNSAFPARCADVCEPSSCMLMLELLPSSVCTVSITALWSLVATKASPRGASSSLSILVATAPPILFSAACFLFSTSSRADSESSLVSLCLSLAFASLTSFSNCAARCSAASLAAASDF